MQDPEASYSKQGRLHGKPDVGSSPAAAKGHLKLLSVCCLMYTGLSQSWPHFQPPVGVC